MSEADNPMQKVITKCWEDEAFKDRLLADPAATLAAEGLKVPEGVTVNVAIDSEDVRTLVIPLAPADALSDEALSRVSAGFRRDGPYSEPWAVLGWNSIEARFGCASIEVFRPAGLEDGAPNL